MFAQWKEKRQKKQEERRTRKELQREIREWNAKHYHTVSFCLQDVEFMGYYLPMNLSICENELSLYEATEKSFHEEVIAVFREITEELTEKYHVLQWLRWSNVEPMSAIKKYKAGEKAIFDKDYIVKCTENGVDKTLLDMQMGKGNEWDFIEQEFYCYKDRLPVFDAVGDVTEYIENFHCDLYIMLDLMHAAMMVKTRKAEDLKTVENCMRRVCEKYEKEIHDYIGHLK